MAKAKKTMKKLPIKSKTKFISGGKKVRLSRPAIILLALVSITTLAAIGTLSYSKYKENDLKAKAAAFQLNPNDYKGYKNLGVRFAVCKREKFNSKGQFLGMYLTGIVSRPSLLFFRDGGTHIAYMGLYNSVNSEWNGKSTGAASKRVESTGWFAADPIAYTYISEFIGYSSQTRALELGYYNSKAGNSRVYTVRVPINYLPKC